MLQQLGLVSKKGHARLQLRGSLDLSIGSRGVTDIGQATRRTMQPRRTRSKKGLSAQDSSRCRRTWIVSTSSYEASSITRPCSEHAHGLFRTLPATAEDARCEERTLRGTLR